MKRIQMKGRKFGRLVVVHEVDKTKFGHIQWLCKCDCGKQVTATGIHLRSGHTTSCGCFARDRQIINATTHGLYGTSLHTSWRHMIERCYASQSKGYGYYGGRGIRVCEFLRASSTNLLSLLGEKPSGKTIDRKDNDGHYSCGQCAECLSKSWPQNVRWATMTQQGRNKRNNVRVTFDGATHCITEWAEIFRINPKTIYNRINMGWEPMRAIVTPVL